MGSLQGGNCDPAYHVDQGIDRCLCGRARSQLPQFRLSRASALRCGSARPVSTFPPLEDWHGPWVWPVLIGTSIVWSFSFLFAGIIDTMLEAQGWSKGHRRLVYLAVLWAGAIGAWLIMLYTNMPPDGVRIPG